MTLHIVTTTKGKAAMMKEFRMNSIQYKSVGNSQFIVEDNPKVRMAIKCTRERIGMQNVIIK